METEAPSQLEQEIEEAGNKPGMQSIPIDRLRRMGRRQNRDKLSTSIPGQYYLNRKGWVAHAEGMETAQAQRLVNVKGWRVLDGYPRTLVDQERLAPWHAILRAGGAKEFPPDQIITYRWHKKPPTVLTCRQDLEDFQHPQHDRSCYEVVTFPQLEGVEVFEESCPICPRPPVVSIKGQMDAEAQIKRHMEVAHRDHLVNKELVTGLAAVLGPLVQKGESMDPEAIAQIAAAAAIAAVQSLEASKAEQPTAPEPQPEPQPSGAPPVRGGRPKAKTT